MPEFAEQQPLAAVFVLVWAALVITGVAKALVRVARGQPVLARGADDAVFDERWASGGCELTGWWRLRCPSNCMRITLSPTHLIVQPQFPWSVLLSPSYSRRIRLSDVVAVRQRSQGYAKWLSVSFRNERMETRTIGIFLRQRDAFLAALESTVPAAVADATNGDLASDVPRIGLAAALRRYWYHLPGIALFPSVMFVGTSGLGIHPGLLMPLFFAAAGYAAWPVLSGKAPITFWLVAIGVFMLGGCGGMITMIALQAAGVLGR